MSNYFKFTDAEKKYLEFVNYDYDSRLSKFATQNADAISIRTPRYDIIRPQFS